MPDETLNVRIDLASLQATFFRRLQHQLDLTKVLQVGCQLVSAEQVAEEREFGRFVPSNGSQLSHDQAKLEAQDWLLRGFLRDAIESAGLFLDECLHVSKVMQIGVRGGATGAEINHLLHDLPRINHRLHFPQKLEKLERDFGITTRFNPHVLSLNRARTCVVHRLGQVSRLDTDETESLKVTFQRINFVALGQETGNALLLDLPGVLVQEASMLQVHFVDHEHTFTLGDQIRLESRELYDTIITMWRFGTAAVQSVKSFGRSIGINFDVQTTEQTTDRVIDHAGSAADRDMASVPPAPRQDQ